MDHDELRQHIHSASRPHGLVSGILAVCWPGGSHDRTDQAALQWLRRWHPERAATTLPACSCAAGRCAVCN